MILCGSSILKLNVSRKAITMFSSQLALGPLGYLVATMYIYIYFLFFVYFLFILFICLFICVEVRGGGWGEGSGGEESRVTGFKHGLGRS